MRAKFIYEKFTQDSDPISDLGIGVYKKKIDVKSEKEFAKIVVELIPAILRRKNIPKDIIEDKNKESFINDKYYPKIDSYLQEYITIKGANSSGYFFVNIDLKYTTKKGMRSVRNEGFWPLYIRKVLMDQGFKTSYYI